MRLAIIIATVALTTSGCVATAVRAIAQPRKPDIVEMLEKADANGDGNITKAEYTNARAKMFARLDRNGDGYLTKEDVPRLAARRKGNGDRLQQAELMLDKDGDGRVSRDEFVNSPSLLFDRADTNHDDVVDKNELTAFKAAMAARQ
jgi:Ca2+-binding EF-hand superfamily protein